MNTEETRTTIARSLGRLTKKTVTGITSASKKTAEVSRSLPNKTAEKIRTAKEEMVAGFKGDETPRADTKIGDVDDTVPQAGPIVVIDDSILEKSSEIINQLINNNTIEQDTH